MWVIMSGKDFLLLGKTKKKDHIKKYTNNPEILIRKKIVIINENNY